MGAVEAKPREIGFHLRGMTAVVVEDRNQQAAVRVGAREDFRSAYSGIAFCRLKAASRSRYVKNRGVGEQLFRAFLRAGIHQVVAVKQQRASDNRGIHSASRLF